MSSAPDPFADDPWLGDKSRRPRRTPKWLVFSLVGCGTLIVLTCAGLFAVGVAVEFGWMPQGKALAGKEVPKATLEWLREKELVEADEQLLYFCASGFFALDEGGCLFTDRRVVSYAPREPAGLDITAAPFGDIVLIESTFADDWWDVTLLRIETADLREFELTVSAEGGSDRAFDKDLRETWHAMRALAVPGLSADGSMKLEPQLEVLARFGIVLPEGMSIRELCDVQPRALYEQLPFELLLEVIGGTGGYDVPRREASRDVWLLNFEFVEAEGDYAFVAERLRVLADGALPIEEISDELDREHGVATIHFQIDGKSEHWEAEIDDNWLDASILSRFAALLAEGNGELRLVSATTGDEQAMLVVCVPESQLIDLRRQTGMDFDLLE